MRIRFAGLRRFARIAPRYENRGFSANRFARIAPIRKQQRIPNFLKSGTQNSLDLAPMSSARCCEIACHRTTGMGILKDRGPSCRPTVPSFLGKGKQFISSHLPCYLEETERPTPSGHFSEYAQNVIRIFLRDLCLESKTLQVKRALVKENQREQAFRTKKSIHQFCM